jgi:hypothetical protein
VEDTIELDDIHHGRTVLKATLDGDLEALQGDLVRVRDLLDDEHDRVARDLGVEKNKKLHLENHQVYHYSLRITKAVSPRSSNFFLLLSLRPPFAFLYTTYDRAFLLPPVNSEQSLQKSSPLGIWPDRVLTPDSRT